MSSSSAKAFRMSPEARASTHSPVPSFMSSLCQAWSRAQPSVKDALRLGGATVHSCGVTRKAEDGTEESSQFVLSTSAGEELSLRPQGWLADAPAPWVLSLSSLAKLWWSPAKTELWLFDSRGRRGARLIYASREWRDLSLGAITSACSVRGFRLVCEVRGDEPGGRQLLVSQPEPEEAESDYKSTEDEDESDDE